MPIRMRISVALLGAAVLAQPLAAQQGTEIVPAIVAKSAMSIFTGMLGEEPTFTNGTLPADWPAALVPASPARIMGGVNMGIMRLAVFSLPAGEDPVARYESLLTAKGASRAAATSALKVTRGFAATEAADAEQRMWCLKDGAAGVSLADSLHDRRTIMVTWVPIPGPMGMRTACNPGPEAASDAPIMVLPQLAPPRGSRITAGGSGGSNDRYEFYASSDTTWTADSLIAHYAREFARSGWIVGRAVANAEIGVVPLTKPDARAPWHGALFVTTGPGRRDLLVRMLRVQAR